MESDDMQRRLAPPITTPTRRRRRALLRVLAGGGLTAVGLTGPLSGGALADAPTGSTAASETPPTQAGGQSTTGAVDTGAAGASSTTTSSTPSASTPAPTSSSAAPTGTAPAAATPAPTASAAPTAAPVVVVQSKQKTTPVRHGQRNSASSTGKRAGRQAPATSAPVNSAPANGANTPAAGPNNVALPPQLVAAHAGALSASLIASQASVQALDFYRIPLFLLPIYQAAGIQYGVPWQVLAAINEVETDYGSNLAVSTAGAVGWMQFEPQTWVQYGVDANRAGYADPFNPVDAIFAAARYLRAAGAGQDLHRAILAYNHSGAYVDSVLLRAKLISSFPQSVIATLTGLTEGRPPVAGVRVDYHLRRHATLPGVSSPPPSNATAGAALLSPSSTSQTSAAAPAAGSAPSSGTAPGSAPAPSATGSPGSTPGSTPAPSPLAAASTVRAADQSQQQHVDLLAARNANVVAVADGRVVKIGRSRKLGDYLILRDVYGDLFTYSRLGSVAASYRVPNVSAKPSKVIAGLAKPAHDPAPAHPASAGRQLPVTLHVQAAANQTDAAATPSAAPLGVVDKVRLFAHPDNPVAKASARSAALGAAASVDANGDRWLPLQRGSVVTQGTVLGRVSLPPGAVAGHLRFAIRPAGDRSTIDPKPVLRNWKQLDTALHPKGAKGGVLLGATAGDVFLLSKGELERQVLGDPGINIYQCGRQDIASGAIDRRVLAVLAFLSRSGLKPTVSALRCGHSEYTTSGNVSEHFSGDAVDIDEINGIPITGHQGAGSITDTTIRALLTLQGQFVPHQIISLMQYPGQPNTLALPDHYNHIHVGFHPQVGAPPPSAPMTATDAAHSAGAGRTAPSPLAVAGDLSREQWDKLVARIGALPTPTVASKPSRYALRDTKAAPANRDLGTRALR
jgi:soluble lytic murein transglycosylase-like protein